MLAKQAKDAARHWVIDNAPRIPGYIGAYHTGSVNWLPDDAAIPVTSDVDVQVVVDDIDDREKLGKFVYRGVILEVSYTPVDRLRSPEEVLGEYHMAPQFSTPNIISDPLGRLTEFQAAVYRDYARRK